MTALFSSPKAPAAPDPVATANAQSAANAETARLQARMNMIDTYTPYGSVTYKDLGGDRYAATATPSEAQQRIISAQDEVGASTAELAKSQLSRIGEATAGQLDFSQLPSLTGSNDFSADRLRVEQAILDRNAPIMAQQRAGLENQLKNQGIQPGSEAWTNAMRDLSMQENDFRLAAQASGGAEQSRMYGLQSDARQRLLSEALLQRSQPINELAALLGTGQVNVPQVNPVQTQVAPTDVVGAYDSAARAGQARYATQSQLQGQLLGGLIGAGGAFAGGAAAGGYF